MSSIDSYGIAAKYYDGAYNALRDQIDAAFYLELARQYGGPVLEIGCGTGRVLLPIARAGIAIDGVDNSGAMLRILHENILKEEAEVRDRISIHVGDMRDFHLNRKYRLITIPFRPLQLIYALDDQLRTLTSAAEHLAEEGVLALDVFHPKFDRLDQRIGEEQLEAEWSPPSQPGVVIRRYFRKDSVDKIHQILRLTLIFRTLQSGCLVSEETEKLTMSYYTYPHLKALFRLAGLKVVAEYGSFAKTELSNNAEEMIFLVQAMR